MNEGMITFDPSVPLWLVGLLFVPATIFFLWKEWRRKLRFRTQRIVAVLIMMLMLAAIFLHPQSNLIRSGRTLILTHGYNTRQIDSLMVEHADLRIVHTPEAEPYKNSRPLKSYFEVIDLEKSISFVAGEGLPLHVLALLDQRNFKFIPGEQPSGIVELSSPNHSIVNRQNSIAGTFRNVSGRHSILLTGPGGKEDSVTTTANGTTSFDLSFTPRQAGPVLYTLTVKDNEGNVIEEKIPVVVDDFSPLTVLVVLSYPTFETTFLKNFIGSKGNRLVLRSQLSRNNFGYEYVNHHALRFSALTKDVLDQFDLLIADQATLQRLSKQESSVLKQSIQNGLGLLAIYDELPKQKTEDNFFPFQTISVKGDTTTIGGALKKQSLPVLPFRIVNKTPLQTVLRNDSGVLSGYTLSGKGKIGFQLMQQTYRLMLAGDTIAYGNLWSPLLERIARSDDQMESTEFTNAFPYYVDEPLHLKLISSEDSPTLLTDSVRISLREDVLLDDVWRTTVWPTTPGWHTIQTASGTQNYYVYKADEWRSIALENQMKGNYLTSVKEYADGEATNEKRRIPALLFYAVFLTAAGFLWLAPKL